MLKYMPAHQNIKQKLIIDYIHPIKIPTNCQEVFFEADQDVTRAPME
jgi:hypothetical protein